MAKTLILGLGNPILGDDGVGWQVASQVAGRVAGQMSASFSGLGSEVRKLEGEAGTAVEIDCLAVGGLALMERMVGYDRAILIDAISTGQEPVGSVSCFSIEALPDRASGHLSSAHDTSLQKAIQVGRALGAPLPEEIVIVAIEAQNLFEFSEELTPAVAAAVSTAVEMVTGLIHHYEHDCPQ